MIVMFLFFSHFFLTY